MKTLFALLMLTAAAQAQEAARNCFDGSSLAAPCAPTIIRDLNGACRCFANGKDWACRKVRGDMGGSIMAVNRCHGGGYQLSCPEDKSAVCQYVMLPPVCTEPPLTDICYAADEPK